MQQSKNGQKTPSRKRCSKPPALEPQDGVGLPPPAQLAQIAAGFGADILPKEAIHRAVGLYLWAWKIIKEHANDTPSQLARAFGDQELSLAAWVESFGKPFDKMLEQVRPPKYPLTFDDMLRCLMPKVDKTAERQRLFRRYLKDEVVGDYTADSEAALVSAGEWIADAKKGDSEAQSGGLPGGIDEKHFEFHAIKFLNWQDLRISGERRKAGVKGRKAQKKLAPPAQRKE